MKRLTFSKNIFIPVTDICINRCAYCSFRRNGEDGKLISRSAARELIELGAKKGCTEALFSMGQSPWGVPGFDGLLAEVGHSDLIDYLIELCEMAIDAGLLPHTNAGVLSGENLSRLKPYNASMGLMLESAARLPAHAEAPFKDPSIRLDFMSAAGRLRIPFTTGLLIGIGESWQDIFNSLDAIARIHRQFGHIQEVIIQPFDPKPKTAMANSPGPDIAFLSEIVRLAREILSRDVAIQIPPNLINPLPLLDAGASDLGGISPVTLDWINPLKPWPKIAELIKRLDGYVLRERLAIYPGFIKKGWYGRKTRDLIILNADEEGLRRKSISSSDGLDYSCE